MRRLSVLLTLLVLAATPAVASDPESGEVSRATPKVTWSGAITSFQSWQTYSQGQGQCLPPSCDTFTLTVKDGPAPLNITVESADSTIIVEVVKPDGSKEQFEGATKAVGKIKSAANGEYTINVAQNEQTQATHKGTAELVFPATTSPTAPPAPAPAQPAAAPDTTISLGAKKLKKKVLPVSISASAPVTRVAATLKRGSKTVAKGSLARVESNGVIKLKFKARPKRGRHTLKVTAVDGQGRSVSGTLTVKI